MPTDEHTSTSEDFCNGKEDNAHSNSSSSHRNNHKIKQQQEEELIEWMNSLNLSKPVKNFGRDCSDAVVIAEIIAHYLPRYVVTLNSFVHVHSLALKKYNWQSLDKVVLRHLGIRLSNETIESLAQGEERAIQEFLPLIRSKIDEALEQRRFRPSSRSRPSSRGGSQLHLDQIGQVGNSQKQTSPTRSAAGREQQTNGGHPQLPQSSKGQAPPAVLDEMDKDQVIERLYAKVRAQETQLARKDEQISALTRRVEKLVELICDQRKNGASGMDRSGYLNNNGDFD